MGKGRVPSVDNFWNKVRKADGDACWEWQGYRYPFGYGRVRYATKDWLTHRFAWTLANGPIPDGMQVCHRCDNPSCVRADHLFLGTQDDNMKDRAAKGRAPRGPGNRMSKFTEEQVRSIRKEYAAGGTSFPKLAAKHNVSMQAISHIVHRKNWAWLPD